MLFGDRDAALFAGLLIALMPEQLLWSATAAVEPSASLALVASVVCAAHYLRAGGWLALGRDCGGSRLRDPVSPGVAADPAGHWFPDLAATSAWNWIVRAAGGPRVLFLWLLAIHVAHLFAIRHSTGVLSDRASRSDTLKRTCRSNGWFYLYDERFPVAFTVLAVIGLVSFRQRRDAWSMAMYFLLFFAIDLVFYAGSYNYGADVRYSLMTYPPIAVLGGLGAAWLATALVDHR